MRSLLRPSKIASDFSKSYLSAIDDNRLSHHEIRVVGTQEECNPCYFVRQAGSSYRYLPDQLFPFLLAVVYPIGRSVYRSRRNRVQIQAVLTNESGGQRLYRDSVKVLSQDIPVTGVVTVNGRTRTNQDNLAIPCLLHVFANGPYEMIGTHEVDLHGAKKIFFRQFERVLLPTFER